MDKAERVGLRMCDLLDFDVFEIKARALCERKNETIVKLFGAEPLDIEEILAEYKRCADIIRPYITDSLALLHKTAAEGANILFEGAQGTLLDLTIGTYPYVTSSNPIAGGVCIGAGIGPTAIDKVLGIVKAYTTRVGKGPFVTELLGERGDALRREGPRVWCDYWKTASLRMAGYCDIKLRRTRQRTYTCGGITYGYVRRFWRCKDLYGI